MMHADYSFHVCAYLLKLSLFLPPLLGHSGLIKQDRERTIKNIEDQKQLILNLNPKVLCFSILTVQFGMVYLCILECWRVGVSGHWVVRF